MSSWHRNINLAILVSTNLSVEGEMTAKRGIVHKAHSNMVKVDLAPMHKEINIGFHSHSSLTRMDVTCIPRLQHVLMKKN